MTTTITRPAFVEGLRHHGDRTALITGDGPLTYRELADRVEAMATRLGAGRRLVLVEAGNDAATLVAYLAALHGGHVPLLAPGGDPDRVAALTQRFDPDVVAGPAGLRPRRPGCRHRLHPDLALLLTTSGSTGEPRLVRLSAAALDANAAAIATYLGIVETDRAALTLPVHYCYGLSVINSNLLCGAAVLLSDASVVEPSFWAAVARHQVTSLHGVPYTFDLLERAGFADRELPHLRYVTQAGGRLPPDRVRHWAAIGRRRGWELYVMYGQTEATARMAYLPPALAVEHPGAIGVAIPGGTLSVEPLDGDVGELVYRGPNVMLGCAETPADLALGRTVDALRTGDLGRRTADGLFEIVGRRARFVKPFGVRTDLDGVERLLAREGIEAACAGTDERIVVAARSCDPAPVAALVTGRLRLPAHAVTVRAVAELPRRPNGKLDHAAVLRLAEPDRRSPKTVRDVFAATFPGQEITDDVSFTDLGGDSLTYVRVAAAIERALGRLPTGWEHLPLRQLEAGPAPVPARRRVTIESGVLMRALAIVLVVGEHAHLWSIVGGAHLLFALAGWTFARFALPARERPSTGSLPRRILRSAVRIAAPSSAWIAFRALLHNVRFVDVLLVGSLIPPLVPGYWFVDDLVQILLLLAALFALPVLRRVEQRHPFGFAAAVLGIALIGRLDPTAYGWWFSTDIYSVQVIFWLFVLGWLAQRAHRLAQRWTTVAAILVLVPTFFGADVLRTVIVVAGLLVLQFVPTLRVPAPVASVATAVASASLAIYLLHFGILPAATWGVPPVAILAASVASGVAVTWGASAVRRRLARRARPAPGGGAARRPPAIEAVPV